MRAVCTPQREEEQGIYSRETSFVGGLAQCRDWTDTRDEERRWVGGSSDLSRCSLQTWKSVGVGLDGGGAGGLHRKLQAWVHRAVEGVLGWGGAGAQCRAGQGAGGYGWGQVAIGVGRGALCSGIAGDPAELELHAPSLAQAVGIEGTSTLPWGQPAGERAPTPVPLTRPRKGFPPDLQCWGLTLS